MNESTGDETNPLLTDDQARQFIENAARHAQMQDKAFIGGTTDDAKQCCGFGCSTAREKPWIEEECMAAVGRDATEAEHQRRLIDKKRQLHKLIAELAEMECLEHARSCLNGAKAALGMEPLICDDLFRLLSLNGVRLIYDENWTLDSFRRNAFPRLEDMEQSEI